MRVEEGGSWSNAAVNQGKSRIATTTQKSKRGKEMSLYRDDGGIVALLNLDSGLLSSRTAKE